MADHVLRLKLALLGSALRPGRDLARSLPVIVLAAAVGWGIIALALAVDPARADHRAAVVVVASALSIGIAVAPLSAGLGSALEPRRFAAFSLDPRRLALSLALAGAVGVPGVLAAVLGIGLELAWSGTSGGGAAIAAGVIAALAIILTSQYLVAIGAQLAISAPARRLITAVARTVIVLSLTGAATAVLAVVPLGAAEAPDEAAAATLVVIAATLANTPVGMLWAAPGSELAPMLARLLGGGVMLAVLAVGWGWVVARLLEAPQRTQRETSTTNLGWFDLAPATPAGVIAVRSLHYWLRDPRYRLVLLGVPLAPVLMMLTLGTAGAPLPPLWLLPLPVLALFVGWFAHNDAAYDSTALWVHVAAPVPGIADRWGRCVPPLLIGLLLLPPAPLFVLWSGVDGALPALLGVTIGLLLTGLGVSSISSAVGAYPAARPGAGPFDQPPTLGARAGWAQALSLLAVLALMSPALLTAAWGFTDPAWFVVSGIAGAATGVGVLLLGLVVGGRAFRRRAPELLDLALRG